jgi:hypothetical protein
MLNGNKAQTARKRSLFDMAIRATKKTVVLGLRKRGERRQANQNLMKEFSL